MSVLGFGTVGRALAARLAEEPALPVRLVSVTDRSGTVADPRGLDPAALLALKERAGSVGGDPALDAARVVERVDADVVVDLLPTDLRTGEPSRSLALAALAHGKHVVLAGKGALALHGREVRMAAARHGLSVLGSATVCGGTPVLELLSGAFRGDRVERIEGVLNGSTNLLLSLLESGESWEDALARARHLGVLEADPSLDLLGLDAAAKAVILANHAWDLGLSLPDARVRGVMGVTAEEAREARSRGLAVRLVARASPAEGVAVAPVALPREHPLVTDGTENAVRLKLAGAGHVCIRGPGAGGRETAAAVLSDVLALEERGSVRRSASVISRPRQAPVLRAGPPP